MKYITKRNCRKRNNKSRKYKNSKRVYLLCKKYKYSNKNNKKYKLKGGATTSVPSNVSLPMMIDANQKVYSCTLVPGQ
jgi:hypothetical protein